ncbi:MAG TPA: Mpo1-like protein [Xanthobacteraceae bacterium]|nr:Mpo1-like protein [Xanthobacteraceae bacterium]
MNVQVHAIRRVEALLAEYGRNHHNPTNKVIHGFAVPTITWATLAILWSVPTPALFDSTPYLNWATILCALALAYYLTLSIPLALGMATFSAIALAIVWFVEVNAPIPLIYIAAPVFIFAWMFLFVGHIFEDRSLSFLIDLQFLVIEPVWFIHLLFRRLGIPY